QLAETIGLIGPHSVARWAYQALAPYAGLFAVEGIGAVVRGPVHHPLAVLAAASGNRDAARKHFAAAVDATVSLGAPYLRQRIESAGGVSIEDGSVFRRDGEY